MQLNEKIGQILVDNLKNFARGELPIITSIIIGSILTNGINYFKNMTDEEAEHILEELNKPIKNKKDGKHRIKITTPELDKSMLTIKRQICQTCDTTEIENLIIYCNREYCYEYEAKKKLFNDIFELISEKSKITDDDIAEYTGLSSEEFEDLTGWELNLSDEQGD